MTFARTKQEIGEKSDEASLSETAEAVRNKLGFSIKVSEDSPPSK